MPLTVAISPWQLIDAGEDGVPSPQLVIVPEAGQSPLTVITGPVACGALGTRERIAGDRGCAIVGARRHVEPGRRHQSGGGLVIFPTDSSTTSPAPICTGMSVSEEPLVLAGVSQK